MHSQFFFATCHPGLETALVQELAARQPRLRRSFSRPGFLTLKQPDRAVGGDARLQARLVRAYGVSLGPAPSHAQATVWIRDLVAAHGPLQAHAWSTQPEGAAPTAWVEAVQAATPGCWSSHSETVLDVMAVDANQVWLGWHRAAGHSPHAGGCMPVAVPAAAPSRAYGKMVEALAWSGMALRPGDTVLELGSAPGGGTYALLERGQHVVAVDPGALDDGVAALARAQGLRLRHVRQPVARLQAGRLPPVAWVFSDMNLAPSVVVRAMRRLLPALRPHVQGVLMNWKLNDLKVVDQVDGLLHQMQSLGCTAVRAAHLGQHRREIAVWAGFA